MKTVVYVDDEPQLCRVFRRILRGFGMAAEAFSEPEEALSYIASNEVSVVVCDYVMPRCSGLDLLARLDRDLPFILVSGDIDARSIMEAHPRVTRVLTKPFSPETLVEVLRPYVG